MPPQGALLRADAFAVLQQQEAPDLDEEGQAAKQWHLVLKAEPLARALGPQVSGRCWLIAGCPPVHRWSGAAAAACARGRARGTQEYCSQHVSLAQVPCPHPAGRGKPGPAAGELCLLCRWAAAGRRAGCGSRGCGCGGCGSGGACRAGCPCIRPRRGAVQARRACTRIQWAPARCFRPQRGG